MRDGTELVGWGMATGVWEALQMPAAVRITLTADAQAEIACAIAFRHSASRGGGTAECTWRGAATR